MRKQTDQTQKWFARLAAVLLLISLLSGCSFGKMPTSPPAIDTQPTLNAIQTEMAKTAIVELTLLAPSPLPLEAEPTATQPAPTATTEVVAEGTKPPAPTATPVPPTATVPAATATAVTVSLPCRIDEARPAYGADFARKADFDGYWKVTNIGATTWDASQVDVKYIGGTRFQRDVSIMDLGKSVAKDDSYTVIVDMVAPEDYGRYSTTWAIVDGTTTLCVLSLTIDVTK